MSYEQARQMARNAKTPGELADAIILAQKVADETLDSVERIVRADERRHVIAQIREQIMEVIVGHAAASDGREVELMFAILDDLSTPEQK